MIAGASLWLGIDNRIEANSKPEVMVSSPKLVRMYLRPASGIDMGWLMVSVEPVYALMKTTTKTALIKDVTLEVTKPDGGKVDPRDIQLLSLAPSYGARLDPEPIVVTQATPAAPYLQFGVANPASLTPGRWSFTVVARTADDDVVSLPFCVNVTDRWANFVNRSTEDSGQLIPIFRNDFHLREDPSECYRGSGPK